MTLQLLLEHCSSWIEKVDLNQEMPEIKFHVADTKGNKDGRAVFAVFFQSGFVFFVVLGFLAFLNCVCSAR